MSEKSRIFVMGATGRVGVEVARSLRGLAVVRSAARGEHAPESDLEWVRFDLDDPSTFPAALAGVDSMFLMRPPQTVQTQGFEALLRVAQSVGIRRLVFLSVAGAEHNALLPHHAFEKAIRKLGFQATMVRPADFMQNLETVHRDSIILRNEIAVPAGAGRSPFVDVADVGAVVAKILLSTSTHPDGYTLTGPAALSFGDVTQLLSDVLGRPIRYRPVSIWRFMMEQRQLGGALMLRLVMSALYTVQKFGWATPVTGDIQAVLGRAPASMADYVRRNREVWITPPLARGTS